MKKGIAKKIKALLFTTVMVVGVLATVPAGKVEAGSDEDGSSVSLYDPTTWDSENYTYKVDYLSASAGSSQEASWDEKSKTLTLNNFNHEKAILNASAAEGDLNISLKGDNKLAMIDIMVSSY